MDKRIKIEVDRSHLSITPKEDGSALEHNPKGEFILTFTNKSSKFANFKVELASVGVSSGPSHVLNHPSNAEKNAVSGWYRIEPESCTKTPPGGSTVFKITVVKAPLPIYDTSIELMLRVFAIEDANLWNIKRFTLTVEQPQKPLQLMMPNKLFRVSVGEQIDIPVLVYNHGASGLNVTLNCDGIEPNWLQDGGVQTVYVEPNRPKQVSFACQLPDDLTVQSQTRQFTVDAHSDALGHRPVEQGHLEVTPGGILEFVCEPQRRQIPLKKVWDKAPPNAAFLVTLKNASNCHQQVELYTTRESQQTCSLILPEAVILAPDESRSQFLKIQKRRPWIGLSQKLFFDLYADSKNIDQQGDNSPIRSRPEQYKLELEILPLVPIWLFCLLGFLAALLLWLYYQLNPTPVHRASVNSIQLNGTADQVFSGSSDKTVQHWKIGSILKRPRLDHKSEVGNDQQQPIEVIRLKPANNNEIAVGFDNGEIQLWDVLKNQVREKLSREENSEDGDRVFALEFTADSKALFSGHGSGWVKQWDLQKNRFINKLNAGFAVQTVGINFTGSELAIAGRFDKIIFWDWKKNVVDIVSYQPALKEEGKAKFAPIFGQQSYIESVVMKDQFLVASDNRGLISVWNWEARKSSCKPVQKEESQKKYPKLNIVLNAKPSNTRIPTIRECIMPQIDAWIGHGGKPVRSLAIDSAKENFHLASVGADGKVKLWKLAPTGEHQGEAKVLKEYAGLDLRAVDIKVKDANVDNPSILVTSDAPNNQVKIYRVTP
jgi:WD40 repeat protein